MGRIVFLFFAFLFSSSLLVHAARPMLNESESGGGSAGSPPGRLATPPPEVADSFSEIYFKWVNPLQEVGVAVILLVLISMGFSVLLGGGAERLQAIKHYLIFAVIALFLIWNAQSLALWLWHIFLK